MNLSSMPWIKLYTDLLDDTKLGRVSERVRWRFVQLLLMAGESDAEGYLVNGDKPMSTDDIAWRLRLSVRKVADDLASLSNIGVLENTPNGWRIVKFSERQGRKQSEKRAQWRKSQTKRRQKSSGPEWKTEETPEELTPVIHDVSDDKKSVIPLEKRRGEERREETSNGADAPAAPTAPAPEPLTEEQRSFLETFGAKRFKTHTQRDAVGELATKYPASFAAAVQWAAKRGMNMGAAILSLEKALPKWGQEQANGNGRSGQHGRRGDAGAGRSGREAVPTSQASLIARQLSRGGNE